MLTALVILAFYRPPKDSSALVEYVEQQKDSLRLELATAQRISKALESKFITDSTAFMVRWNAYKDSVNRKKVYVAKRNYIISLPVDPAIQWTKDRLPEESPYPGR